MKDGYLEVFWFTRMVVNVQRCETRVGISLAAAQTKDEEKPKRKNASHLVFFFLKNSQ
jgi:hypothetical protein